MSDSSGGTLEERAYKFWTLNLEGTGKSYAQCMADFARQELEEAAKIAEIESCDNVHCDIPSHAQANRIAAAIRAYAEQGEKGTK